MTRVSLSEFRQHMHSYIKMLDDGQQVALTNRGKTVAVLSSPEKMQGLARAGLEELRTEAFVGDVESPVGESWEAEDVAT